MPHTSRLQPCSFNGLKIDGIGAEAPVPDVGGSGEYLLVLRNTDGADGVTAPSNPMERYQELMAYSRHAGEFTTHQIDDGRYQYVEETPPDYGRSLLIRLETPDGCAVPGRYGLLESVDTNQPPHAEGPIALTASLFYLAPLSRYRSRAELRTDLEAPGF